MILLDEKNLAELTDLEWSIYAGELSPEKADPKKMNELRMVNDLIPVRVIPERERKGCPEELYAVVLTLEREHESMRKLRRDLIAEIAKTPYNPIIYLTANFDGIYVGELEDLRNWRRDKSSELLYPIDGFSQKIAHIQFRPGNLPASKYS